MEKRVLNTVILEQESGGQGPGPGDPSESKYVFWGITDKRSEFNAQDILALSSEQREDRFITVNNWNSGGKRMIAAFPVAYGSTGLFQDLATGWPYQFDAKGIVTLTDAKNNTYDVSVYLWRNVSYGSISLKSI